MITQAMERADEFLASTEFICTDVTSNVEQIRYKYLNLINDAISELASEPKQTIRIFTAKYPTKDVDNQYAKWLAWHDHLEAEGEALQELYYVAGPYSPLYGSHSSIEERVRSGMLQESDKDIWEIMFIHPGCKHFYIVKYIPGVDGHGFGYKVSVSSDWDYFNGTKDSVASGDRYNFES